MTIPLPAMPQLELDLAPRAHAFEARTEVRLQVNNVLNTNAYAGGHTDGATRYFFPIATRNVLVTTRYAF